MKRFRTKDFIIAKYRSSFLGETRDEWCRVSVAEKVLKRKDGILRRTDTTAAEITKEQAKKIIAEYGLVQVHKNQFGTIYDTPDMMFQRMYAGTITYYE